MIFVEFLIMMLVLVMPITNHTGNYTQYCKSLANWLVACPVINTNTTISHGNSTDNSTGNGNDGPAYGDNS